MPVVTWPASWPERSMNVLPERLFTVHPRAGMAGAGGTKRHMLIARNGGAVRPACGCSTIVRLGMNAARVPVADRCTRSGCAERWPRRSHRGD